MLNRLLLMQHGQHKSLMSGHCCCCSAVLRPGFILSLKTDGTSVKQNRGGLNGPPLSGRSCTEPGAVGYCKVYVCDRRHLSCSDIYGRKHLCL